MTIQQVIKHAQNEIDNGIALRDTLDDEIYKELIDESIQRWTIIKKALEKQIEIDESIPTLRECVEKLYVCNRTNDLFWIDTIDHMRTRARALYEVSANKEKHTEDICMMDCIWEELKIGVMNNDCSTAN